MIYIFDDLLQTSKIFNSIQDNLDQFVNFLDFIVKLSTMSYETIYHKSLDISTLPNSTDSSYQMLASLCQRILVDLIPLNANFIFMKYFNNENILILNSNIASNFLSNSTFDLKLSSLSFLGAVLKKSKCSQSIFNDANFVELNSCVIENVLIILQDDVILTKFCL